MSHPIRNSNFRVLLISRLAATLGIYFLEVALMWWVLETTGRSSSVAWAALSGVLVYLVAAPFSGALADRTWKKGLAAVGYLISGLVPLVALYLLRAGWLSFFAVLALVAFDNLATALRAPALRSLTPLVLSPDQYAQGNALMAGTQKIAALASMPLGGLLIGKFGVAPTLLVTAALYTLSALVVVFVNEPRVAAREAVNQSGSAGSVVEGFRALLSSPVLTALVITAALINLVLSPLAVLMAPFAKLLGAGPEGYGLLGGAVVAGELLGFISLSIVRGGRPLAWLLVGNFGIAASLALLAFAGHLVGAMVALAVGGVAAALMNVQLETIAQKSVPEDLLGRAFGLLSALSMGAQPLGYAFSGILLSKISVTQTFLAMALLLLGGAFLWLRPAILRSLAGLDASSRVSQ